MPLPRQVSTTLYNVSSHLIPRSFTHSTEAVIVQLLACCICGLSFPCRLLLNQVTRVLLQKTISKTSEPQTPVKLFPFLSFSFLSFSFLSFLFLSLPSDLEEQRKVEQMKSHRVFFSVYMAIRHFYRAIIFVLNFYFPRHGSHIPLFEMPKALA